MKNRLNHQQLLNTLNLRHVLFEANLSLEEQFAFENKILRAIQQKRDQFIINMYDLTSKVYIKFSKSKKWACDKKQLSQMPTNSLGHQLYQFLEKHEFDLIPYVENHDVFHLIAQIQPNVKGEVGLQCLLYGNGKKSLFLFMSICAGLILAPEYYVYYLNCYKQGQTMNRFYDWDFEYLLKEDFQTGLLSLIYKK
jgi:hypothetical protein